MENETITFQLKELIYFSLKCVCKIKKGWYICTRNHKLCTLKLEKWQSGRMRQS